MSSESPLLGIDVGGTNVKLAVVNSDGKILARDSASTPSLNTPRRVFEYAVEFSKSVGQVSAVGLAVPGVLDTREFVLREVVNLPGWVEQPLHQILSEVSGLPGTVLNDANAAAFAEHHARLEGPRPVLLGVRDGGSCGAVPVRLSQGDAVHPSESHRDHLCHHSRDDDAQLAILDLRG